MTKFAQPQITETLPQAIATTFGAISQRAKMLVARIGREMARRRAEAELMALDDRLLKDIGLFRGDIELVAEGYLPYGRKPPVANENTGRPANDSQRAA